VTTQALGEEGDQADGQLIESGWESTSTDDYPFDDESTDVDPFDTAL
jgi:hypothetical protein